MKLKGALHRWVVPALAASLGAIATLFAVYGAGANMRAATIGPFGPEGPRMREQLWIVPSGDPRTSLRATVFRPGENITPGLAPIGGPQRHPMVVINHGTSEATRHSVSMPVYYWLSRWFVDRGFVVVLPQRRGHGATGGELIESKGNCSDPHHYESGVVAAEDIAATVNYMAQQDFIAPSETIVVGISTGGWASLALASRNVPGVRGIVNFAGGRGGYAFGKAGAVCQQAELVAAAGKFGATAHIPSLWLYADNDSYFGPTLAKAMFDAWSAAGASGSLHVFPAYGNEGHNLADDLAGWRIWGHALTEFLQKTERHRATDEQRAEPNVLRRLKSAALGWLRTPGQSRVAGSVR